jgi:hypothetical protein
MEAVGLPEGGPLFQQDAESPGDAFVRTTNKNQVANFVEMSSTR